MISLLPLLILPMRTSPLISEMIAGLEGVLASKSSVTRGRPPVISFDLPIARGILMITSPILTLDPSATGTCAPTGRLYCLSTSPASSTIKIEGFLVLSFASMMTLSLLLEYSSADSSRKVTPPIILSKRTVPAVSTMVMALYGSHSQIRSPFLTLSPSFL